MRTTPLPLLTRAARWLLVVAWIGTVPGLLPAFFAALAGAEGSHDVSVRSSHGSISVVLAHHAQAGRTHESIHHHGRLAGLLCTVAGNHRDDPDHEAQFAGCSETDDHQKRNLIAHEAASSAPKAPTVDVARMPGVAAYVPAKSGFSPGTLDHAPPVVMAALRSTLLLI